MAIVRWRPWDEFSSLRRDMNRMMDSFIRGVEKEDELSGVWSPDVDVKETPDEFIITAELPGMKKDDLKITIQENVLNILGEKRREEEVKGMTYHRVERVYGQFTRSFTLPGVVDASKINAVFKDGVLNLTLPKAPESKPKEVNIKIG